MKKQFITLGLMFVAALTLTTNCVKEEGVNLPSEEETGVPFELFAGIETKTATDGSNVFSWVEKDDLAVFYREHGTSGDYSANNKFTFDEGTHFTGTLAAALVDGKNYDWWVLYPYRSAITTPENTDQGALTVLYAQTQKGNSNTEHLAGENFPLYGKATNVAYNEKPTITVNQALAVVKVHVTNNTGAPLTVSSVSLTAPESITGKYYIGFAGATPVFTEAEQASMVAVLKVTDGAAIADGSTADFYIGIKPFTQDAAGELIVTVNGLDKVINLPAGTKFQPGKFKTVNFNYNGVSAYTWVETPIESLTASDLFAIVGNNKNTYALSNDNGTSSAPTAVPVTVSGTILSGGAPANARWTIASDAGSYTFYLNGGTFNWLYCTSSNNGVRVGTNANKLFTISDGYLKNSATNRFVGIYNSADWRCYTNTSGNIANQTFKFYKRVTGSLPEPGMSWSAASATATYSTGNSLAFEAPTLTLGNASSVTYSSSDETIATIDENTGEVTVNLTGNDVKEGSTTISASFAGDATYQAQTVNYTLTVVDSREAVATPTFDPAAGDVAANTVVSFQCGTAGVTFYYTVDGTDPTTASTSGATVTINTTKTVKVLAAKTGYKNSAVASATYIVASGNDGSLEHPYTVPEALAIISGYSNKQKSETEVYVSGIIANVVSYNGTYHSVTYNISEDGTETNMLNIYSGKFVANTPFSSKDQIAEGDDVIVYGYLKLFGTTQEMDLNNYMYSWNGITKALTAGTLTATPDNANKQITVTWGAATGSSETISYAVTCGTQNYNASAAGSHTFTMADYGTYSVTVVATASDAISVTASTSATLNAPGGGSLVIDFESEAASYTDWTFTNMTSKQTSSITAHGGTYYGTTGGKATASITTKDKIAKPSTLTFYVSKQSGNTTSSSWKIQVSSDGSAWTDANTQSATSMAKGEWVEVSKSLSTYSDVYVRVYYTGSTAVRNIDDLILTYN